MCADVNMYVDIHTCMLVVRSSNNIYLGALWSSLAKSSFLIAMFSTMASTTRSEVVAAATGSSKYWMRASV